MDVVEVAKKIEKYVKNLELRCEDLEKIAQEKADAISDYDKSLRIRILTLRDEGMAVSIVEKIAKGDCHKQRLRMELAIALVKVRETKIKACEVAINAYQTIYRRLDNI